jgi:hypothetical protein
MSNASSLSLPQVRPTGLVTAVVFLAIRSLMVIPSFFIPTPDDVEVPVFVIVESIIVSALVLFLAWKVWNGSKLAAKFAIGLTAIDIFLTIPAFFAGVGTAMVVLAAIAVVIGVAAIVLLLMKPCWSTLH